MTFLESKKKIIGLRWLIEGNEKGPIGVKLRPIGAIKGRLLSRNLEERCRRRFAGRFCGESPAAAVHRPCGTSRPSHGQNKYRFRLPALLCTNWRAACQTRTNRCRWGQLSQTWNHTRQELVCTSALTFHSRVRRVLTSARAMPGSAAVVSRCRTTRRKPAYAPAASNYWPEKGETRASLCAGHSLTR